MTYEALEEAVEAVRTATGRPSHDVALVLGSGLSGYVASLGESVQVPYVELPGFPSPTVEGHSGMLVSATAGPGTLLVLAGRTHLHEGRPLSEIVFGVRTAVLAGCRVVLLTNAAGGVRPGLEPGDLVLISDHLNLTGRNPLMGDNDARLGPRFPDMSDVYSAQLREVARHTGEEVGVPLKQGVYAWMSGPSYETPAEIEMVGRLGGDLVGMSTVPEAIAVNHMGARALGISVVTNLAAGISEKPLSHEEVTETAAGARERFTTLLDALLPRLMTV